MKVVHHIDGNPRNNDPSNLRLVDMKETLRNTKIIEGELMTTALTHTATDGLKKEEIWKLADHLDEVYKNQQFFNMGEFFKGSDLSHSVYIEDEDVYKYDCRAPACMAGHYLSMLGDTVKIPCSLPTETYVGILLGIPRNDAHALFIPSGVLHTPATVCMEVSPYDANARQCAYLLRHYVETGIVDWEKALTIEELK